MKGETIHCEDGRIISDLGDTIRIFIPMELRRRSGRKVIVAPKQGKKNSEPTAFQKTYAKAYMWQKWIDEDVVENTEELAKKVGLSASVINRYLRLANLSPAIVERFLADDQPEELSIKKMRDEIPLLWSEQERMVSEWVVPATD